jgi:putative heme-binding domain-containing protein
MTMSSRSLRLALFACLAATVASGARLSRAQEAAHGYTQADIERGGQTFLLSCASCHGANGDLVASVSLFSGNFRRATTDQELADLIRRGIPGTPMPPSSLPETDALQVVAYLRSRPATIAAARLSGSAGSAAAGAAIYTRLDCSTCHMVNGSGGFLGPELSSIGLTRPADELERALTLPDADIRNGNRTVSVTATDGTRTVGRLLNQDLYTLQFIDQHGRLTSVRKDAVRRWDVMTSSGMPAYADTLSRQDIADLVSYLQTLTAPPRSGGVAGVQRGGGPRAGAPGPAGAGTPPAAPGRGGRP